MIRTLIIVVIAIFIVGIIYRNFSTNGASNAAQYSNESLGFSFEYRDGEDGYVLQKIDNQIANLENLAEGIVLMQKADYDSVVRGEREGGEAPPTINILVFNNPQNLSKESWLQEYSEISNLTLRTSELQETTISGAEAASYEADGLYASRNTVIKTDNLIYFISGSYLDRDSELYRDYQRILNSFDIQ